MQPFIEPVRLAAAFVVLVLYAGLLGLTCWQGRVRARARARTDAGAAPEDQGSAPTLVVHASQTGTAHGLAQATAAQLRAAGQAARVRSLGELTAAELRAHQRALFVLSTTGEGDPPDEALPFLRRVMEGATDVDSLVGLEVGILSLGDRRFAHFCGFAKRVEAWLHSQGAQPLFQRVEVDALAPADLASWRQALQFHLGAARLVNGADAVESTTPPAQPMPPWRLVERRVSNPGSVGLPVIHIELEPVQSELATTWEAGDLARLVVPGDPRPRDYSIASIPEEGRVSLLVRRVRRADGSQGVASGWLASAPIGTRMPLQLIAHPTFRLGANAERPLVLIGNGTGIAGLRSHLRARSGRRGARHWLLFGERQRAHDLHFGAEITAWQASGVLERVDFAFSRDGAQRDHVQDRLDAEADRLRRWIAEGAAIYVCGSRQGMAQGVDDTLRRALGDAGVDDLLMGGRYRRDVY